MSLILLPIASPVTDHWGRADLTVPTLRVIAAGFAVKV